MDECNQCGKPAIRKINGSPLCVDCFYKFEQAMASQRNYEMARTNFLLDEMEFKLGVPIPHRYRIPTAAVVRSGPVSLNNLNIDGSIIGVVNTGAIANLDAVIKQMGDIGNQELAGQLKQLIEEVVRHNDIDTGLKNEIIEHLDYLTTQFKTPAAQRNKSVVSTIFEKVEQSLSSISSLLTIWEKLRPNLEKFFG